MALISCKFKSPQLGKATEFLAILPEDVKTDFRTVYLLHGHSDDYTAWTRYTSIERYANDRGLAIIMPDAERSFYCDMYKGLPYYSFLMQDLLPYTRRLFRLSDKREDTFVAGLSMGGYGAMKLALRNPDIFAAGATFSGAVDIADMAARTAGPDSLSARIFRDPLAVKGTDDDLFKLAKDLNGCEQKPRIYQECGTEDFLYQDNLRFRDFMRTTDFDFHYEERPGVHCWAFWDVCIQKALDFFLKK